MATSWIVRNLIRFGNFERCQDGVEIATGQLPNISWKEIPLISLSLAMVGGTRLTTNVMNTDGPTNLGEHYYLTNSMCKV